MATNIVRRDDEPTATCGTSAKRYANGYFDALDVESGSYAPINTLQRETAYLVGDIVQHSGLNSKFYLKCTTAGTTAVAGSAPSFSGVTGGDTVTDGTAVWTV